MNCKDFFDIVDSSDVNRLSATERDACEAHAAACRHCAPHWVAFSRLARIPVPSMPQEVAMRCEALAAVESRAASKRKAGRRVVMIGAIVTLAAAAAMVWQMWRESAPVDTPVSAVESVQVTTEPGVHAATDLPPGAATELESSTPAAPADASPRFTVLVMPPRHEAPEASKRGAIEALHAALLEELRKVPGLTLQMPGESAPGAGPVDHVLTLSSLATMLAPAGGTMAIATDGTKRCVEGQISRSDPCSPESPPPNTLMTSTGLESYSSNDTFEEFVQLFGHSLVSDDMVWVELKVVPGSPAVTLTARYTFPAGSRSAPDPRRCPNEGPNPFCMSPELLATRYVNTLRRQVFPLDASYLQLLLSHPNDAGRAAASLDEILRILMRGNGSSLDAGTIRALVHNLANRQAETRANAWSRLSQLSHPGLLAPLLDVLRNDPDPQVRLSALVSLQKNYSTNPQVRRAFEEVDREDRDPVMRAAVRRTLYGPAQWRTDLLAALNNTGLSYEDRLSPLLAMTSGGAENDIETMRMRDRILQEPLVHGRLLALVREHVHDAGHADATGRALNSLYGVEDPAVFAFFMELARDISSLPNELYMKVGLWAVNHAKDPRVREILPQIETANPNGMMLRRLREDAEQRTSQ
jgi:hypothetical protein